MGPVVEPSNDELDIMFGPSEVATWAKSKGDPCHPGTMAGSLFTVMGLTPMDAPADPSDKDWDDRWSELAEFASIDVADFADELRHWKMADMSISTERESPQNDDYETSLTVNPSVIQKGYARAAHNAARIRVGIAKSRTQAEADEWTKVEHAKQAKVAAPATPPGTKPKGQIALIKMSEVVDTTVGGEVQQIDAKTYTDQYKHYMKLMHAPPKASAEPSIFQTSCLMQLFASVCCYVDFSTWVSRHLRTPKSRNAAG